MVILSYDVKTSISINSLSIRFLISNSTPYFNRLFSNSIIWITAQYFKSHLFDFRIKYLNMRVKMWDDIHNAGDCSHSHLIIFLIFTTFKHLIHDNFSLSLLEENFCSKNHVLNSRDTYLNNFSFIWSYRLKVRDKSWQDSRFFFISHLLNVVYIIKFLANIAESLKSWLLDVQIFMWGVCS